MRSKYMYDVSIPSYGQVRKGVSQLILNLSL